MRNTVCNNVSRARVTIARPSPPSPAQPAPLYDMETSHHVVEYVTREPGDGMMP